MTCASMSLVLLLVVTAISPAAVFPASQSPALYERDRVKTGLEALITTGTPRHASHDEGEWLQRAVEEAIRRGDGEIEQLAVRAAAPLTAHITRPVSSIDDPPSLEVDAQDVLTLPRFVRYVARIYVSLDGGALVAVADQPSGRSSAIQLRTRLGADSAKPGLHHLRIRAELAFGVPDHPSWTEVRDLPELFYAVYDLLAPTPDDLRKFIYSPAGTSAADLDPLLPKQPFSFWLADTLGARQRSGNSPPEWVSRYCSERTEEPTALRDASRICTVIYFQAGGRIGEIWLRTGDASLYTDHIEWTPASPPTVEAIIVGESELASKALSMLPGLLDTDPDWRPTADVSIAPEDIFIAPSAARAGTVARATVIVRNRGLADVHKVLIHTGFGDDAAGRGSTRSFVVDIPASGAVEVAFEVMFPRGYGAVLAQVIRLSEHTPLAGAAQDLTPQNACALRPFNVAAAPAGFVASLGDMTGCSAAR